MTELKPNRPLESIINEANDIIEQTKKGELDREPRLARLTELCDDLALTAEEYRNKDAIYALIERLTNALLHEELTDPTPWKSQQSEYPVYSENMLDKRSEKKSRKNWLQNTVWTEESWQSSTRGNGLNRSWLSRIVP